ncbi:hypothetical protein Droror1_Dr00015530 [Drosera rotundifolia]
MQTAHSSHQQMVPSSKLSKLSFLFNQMNSDSSHKPVKAELPGLIRLYDDGSVERLAGSSYVPPTEQDSATGISSKDIMIYEATGLSARLYLPKLANVSQKLPILVYFHGGGFCLESSFSFLTHRYVSSLVAEAGVMAISVEYRLAPEHYLPVAYDDCWTALEWVASHRDHTVSKTDPWLMQHGDFDAVFVGGDSSGANIAHNMIIRAGTEDLFGGLRILGAFMSHPYFLGTKWDGPRLDLERRIWEFVYPNAKDGIDNPLVNPLGVGAPSLAKLGCERVIVLVAGKDELRDAGVEYCDAVKRSGYEGRVEFFEVDGEGHGFHFYDTETKNAKLMIKRLAHFSKK